MRGSVSSPVRPARSRRRRADYVPSCAGGRCLGLRGRLWRRRGLRDLHLRHTSPAGTAGGRTHPQASQAARECRQFCRPSRAALSFLWPCAELLAALLLPAFRHFRTPDPDSTGAHKSFEVCRAAKCVYEAHPSRPPHPTVRSNASNVSLALQLGHSTVFFSRLPAAAAAAAGAAQGGAVEAGRLLRSLTRPELPGGRLGHAAASNCAAQRSPQIHLLQSASRCSCPRVGSGTRQEKGKGMARCNERE